MEALEKPGCPVCRCIRQQAACDLDVLLRQTDADPAAGWGLAQSWGPCGWHAWMWRGIRASGREPAILCRDLLRRARTGLGAVGRDLHDRSRARGWRRLLLRPQPLALVRAWKGRPGCPLCSAAGREEARLLEILLDFIGDPDFGRAYARSFGLCLPHVMLALANFPSHEGAGPLVSRTLHKLDLLDETLREFTALEGHERAPSAGEPQAGEDVAAWRDALAFLAGQPGIFGNEIPRPSASSEGSAPSVAQGARASAPRGSIEDLERRLDELTFEKGRLELRLRELTRQLGEESSRAASLHYRLWSTEEERKTLERKLSAERASARMWESLAQKLRAQIEAKVPRSGHAPRGEPAS